MPRFRGNAGIRYESAGITKAAFQLNWVSPSLSSVLPVVVTAADVLIGNGIGLDGLLYETIEEQASGL